MKSWIAFGLGFAGCLAVGLLVLAFQTSVEVPAEPALVVRRLEDPPRLVATLDEADLRLQLPGFADALDEAGREGKSVLRGPEVLRVPDYVQQFVPPGSDYRTVEYRGAYFYLDLRSH